MKFINKKIINGLAALLSVAAIALAAGSVARANNIQSPDLPPICSNIQVPAGNKAFFHTYALGVQIYRWNGSSWDFVAPLANLYADDDFRWQTGIHYAGPTWEISNGSKVAASRVDGCTPDTSAIAWLLLKTVPTERTGKLKKATYIHRVNTAGGLAPATPGAFIGAEARVPYIAEYYFYRAQHSFDD